MPITITSRPITKRPLDAPAAQQPAAAVPQQPAALQQRLPVAAANGPGPALEAISIAQPLPRETKSGVDVLEDEIGELPLDLIQTILEYAGPADPKLLAKLVEEEVVRLPKDMIRIISGYVPPPAEAFRELLVELAGVFPIGMRLTSFQYTMVQALEVAIVDLRSGLMPRIAERMFSDRYDKDLRIAMIFGGRDLTPQGRAALAQLAVFKTLYSLAEIEADVARLASRKG